MALTRIKSQSILDREVREQDLADGAVSIDKINLLTTGVAGDVLTVDSFGNLLFAPAGGTPITLDSLVDVNTTGVVDGDVLQYNSTTLKWETGAITFGSIDGFTDVDTTTTPPVNGQVLAFDGSLWIPQTVGGAGATSNTFMVDDIAARNLLSPAVGDSAYVRTGASGEWEYYLWDSSWVLIATADSARTDANTIEVLVSFDDINPQLLGNISSGSRVTTVTIDVLTAFTPNKALPSDPDQAGDLATLTVGDSVVNDRLLTNDMIDLTEVGTYVCNVDYMYTNITDTDIFAYFDFTGTTAGQARVIVTHV